jgi:peroxiredoxin
MNASKTPPRSIQPTEAPSFELPSLNGDIHRSAQYKGEIVVINFWASWSPACAREIPDLIILQQEFKAEGVSVLGITMEESDAAKIKEFKASFGTNYPVLQAPPDFHHQFGGIDAIPSTIIIDHRWQMINKFTGRFQINEVRAEIKALLKKREESERS